MHSTGIVMSDEVSRQWNHSRTDRSVSFIKMNITNDTFAIQKIGHGGSTTEDFFKAASNELVSKEAAYIPVRSAPDSDKFILVFYMPANARVHDKMVYAASMSSLKHALGSDNLVGEMSIQVPGECTTEEFDLVSHVHKKTELFTMNEILAYEALYSSQQGLQNESKVSVDLPINVAPAAIDVINKIKSGAVKAASFSLNVATEVLEVAEQGNVVEDLVKHFTRDAPRFSLVSYMHEGSPIFCFVYYCPEKAKAQLKMFYSASKALFLQILASHDVVPRVSFECDSPEEVSSQAFDEILNPVVEEKKTVAKPKARGGASTKKVAKFSDL